MTWNNMTNTVRRLASFSSHCLGLLACTALGGHELVVGVLLSMSPFCFLGKLCIALLHFWGFCFPPGAQDFRELCCRVPGELMQLLCAVDHE